MDFKIKHSFEYRTNLCQKIITSNPNSIPIIVSSDFFPSLKYLTLKDSEIHSVYNQVRNNLNLDSTDALFFLVNNQIVLPNTIVSKLIPDEDGFLYITCCKENTFGQENYSTHL